MPKKPCVDLPRAERTVAPIAGELDELYDLERDPYEMRNLVRSRASAPVQVKLRRELARLVAEAAGLS